MLYIWYCSTKTIKNLKKDQKKSDKNLISFFSLMGYFYGVEIDSLFLTALLTVIGFSVNDTIVVFDRIRENLIKYSNKMSFYEVCNISIFETLNRSLITSFTVIFIINCMIIFTRKSISKLTLINVN